MQKTISKLYKALICGGEISLAALDTTALIRETAARHKLTFVAAAALGRVMTATAYLCSWLKSPSSTLSVTIDGGGAGGRICVSGDGNLYLRGFLSNPEVLLPPRADGSFDVAACVGGRGVLTVTRDDGDGIPFTDACALVSGNIEDDFSAYFLNSEQRPTTIALNVATSTDGSLRSGGIFLQPLPFADENNILRAQETLQKALVASDSFRGEIEKNVLQTFGVETFEERNILFRCRCSAEKALRTVASLGREEAEKLLAENNGQIVVHCHDCNTDYTFGKEDLDF